MRFMEFLDTHLAIIRNNPSQSHCLEQVDHCISSDRPRYLHVPTPMSTIITSSSSTPTPSMLSFIVDDINQVVKFHYLVQFGVALRYRTVSSLHSIGRYKKENRIQNISNCSH